MLEEVKDNALRIIDAINGYGDGIDEDNIIKIDT